ncbi:MAG: SDR family oxidoreductase [Candidatus Andersenbacteria bacterium]|nr:SDR family oxidoreductase [Candidatus Andersenbacteria bacterium]MBI3251145.1 SDR family oxidoreductase [Candidatus Andersenbacteria bacterium]
MNAFDLHGKVILVTGGAGFLAEHFVTSLLEAGAKVALADIALKAVQARAQKLRENVVPVHMDVTKQDSVDEAFAAVIKEFGRIDVVVNNAAIDPKFDPNSSANTKVFENYPEEAMEQSVDVNMLGTWRVSKAAVKHMLESGGGNIISISSMYGLSVPHQDIYPEGTQKPVDYGMTKAAIQYLTKYIAGTYGQKNIRANALVLGGVFKNHDDAFVEKYAKYTMLGRMTDPAEIGAPLVFLASEASKGMTGHLLVVDAGWSA